MTNKDFDQDWQTLSLEVITGMKEWRLQHPTATFIEIETALDERLARLRAKMLADTALASPKADWSQASEQHKPVCEKCGQPLQRRGKHTRTLQTHGGRQVELARNYGVCPQCQVGLFPPR